MKKTILASVLLFGFFALMINSNMANNKIRSNTVVMTEDDLSHPLDSPKHRPHKPDTTKKPPRK